MRAGVILLLFALLLLVAATGDRGPRAAIQDTTLVHKASAVGASVALAPYQTCEPPRAPAFITRFRAGKFA
jgi:hypothetical protein